MMSETREFCSWDETEITTLITLWGAPDIQAALSTARHNARMFETISIRLAKMGVHRTPQQCRTKIKKLKCEWRKVTQKDLDLKRRNAGCKYYSLMASVMANNAALAALENDSNDGVDSGSMPLDLGDLSPSDEQAMDNPSFLEVKLDEQPSFSGNFAGLQQQPRHGHRHHLPPAGLLDNSLKRHLEKADSISCSDDDDSQNDGCSPTPRHKRPRSAEDRTAALLNTVLGTFLDAMRKERQSMREEMARFEEKRIRLENEAELRKLQLEQQHELKMATLLGQITTQIIECLGKNKEQS